jgi:flavin-dependent dehydrogenase
MDRTYDVIIVGARVAGASTAMLLARAGHRVVVLDRARAAATPCRPTRSCDPPSSSSTAGGARRGDRGRHARPRPRRVPLREREVRLETSTTLYAPRRTVLDPLLVDAAERSGAEFRFGVDVRGLLHGDDGRIVGVRVRDEDGRTTDLRARVTVGADGRRSRVAAELQPAVTRTSTTTSAFAYAYVAGVDTDAYEWCYEHGITAGLIPTGDGLTAVFVGVPPDRFTTELTRRTRVPAPLSAAFPSVGERVEAGDPVGPIRGFPGLRGWLRRPWGPGWALVGDAGYFKDPTTAHGITDALRDAELLATRSTRPSTAPVPRRRRSVTTSRSATSSPSRSSPSPTASPASTGPSPRCNNSTAT